jgi:transposase
MDLLNTDLTRLKADEKLQALLLFQSSYKNLVNQTQSKNDLIKKLVKELEEYKQVKIDIKTKNEIYKNLLFGKKSEKLKNFSEDKQKELLNIDSENKNAQSQDKDKQKRAIDQNLESEIFKYVYDELPICDCCQIQMNIMEGQFEKSTEITVVERKYKKKINLRQKYSCSKCNSNIETAPGPIKLKKGSQYSTDFAVQVAIDKYSDHLPLHRQVGIMKRQGLDLKPVTLWNQIEALADHMQALYKAIHNEIKNGNVINSDETRWPLLSQGGKTWWVWGLRSKKACFYKIHESRSGKVPKKLLEGFKGVLQVDAYGGYNQVALEDDISLAYCWAHARRKFFEIKDLFPQETEPILKKISELYFVEKEANSPEEKLNIRKEKSGAILVELKRLISDTIIKSLPRSRIAKACSYSLNHWEGLKKFLENGEIDLDNNIAERSLRNPVLGRKNHLGSKSSVGAAVTSIFYTIFETCKINNVDPQAYLKDIIPNLINKEPFPLPFDWERA